MIHFQGDSHLMGEIAPVIGSLAQQDVTTLVNAGVLIPLFESLSHPDHKVVEASARALRQIVQHPKSFSMDSIQVEIIIFYSLGIMVILIVVSGFTYPSFD